MLWVNSAFKVPSRPCCCWQCRCTIHGCQVRVGVPCGRVFGWALIVRSFRWLPNRLGPRCAGVLVGVPLVVGFSVSRIFAEPFYEYAQALNPEVYSMTPREKVEGAKEVRALPATPFQVVRAL